MIRAVRAKSGARRWRAVSEGVCGGRKSGDNEGKGAAGPEDALDGSVDAGEKGVLGGGERIVGKHVAHEAHLRLREAAEGKYWWGRSGGTEGKATKGRKYDVNAKQLHDPR